MGVFLFVLAVTAVSFWAGFLARPHAFQHRSRAVFLVGVPLLVFAAYLGWRDSTAVTELTRWIEPVPGIVDVMYVPTAAEAGAVAAILDVPLTRRDDLDQDAERLRCELSESRTQYWLLTTSIAEDSVIACCRAAAVRGGRALQVDEPPFLLFGRRDARLMIFVAEDSPRPEVRILFGLTEPESALGTSGYNIR
jgi:hypothetical protein